LLTRGATKGQNTSQNYTAKILQQFKSLFRLAYNKKWIAENPFDKETVETTKTKKSFLPTDKLKALHALVLDSESQKATDIFLFMAYTGLNYQDYAALTQQASLKTHEGKAFIYIPYRQKSPIAKRYGEAYIPILPEVQALIDKYGGIDHLPKDEEANEKLKYVWGKIDAPKDMQLRHARHTYINYLRNEYGLKESTIALIVGHRSTRTTEESYLHKDINTLFKDLQRANL
jgi:integrase